MENCWLKCHRLCAALACFPQLEPGRNVIWGINEAREEALSECFWNAPKLVFYTINKGESRSPPRDHSPEVLFSSASVVSGRATAVASGHFTCGTGFLWPIFPDRGTGTELHSTWTWQEITSEKCVTVFSSKVYARNCLVGKITPWKRSI